MATKTFNPAASSDHWSTAAAWGGTLPVDNDDCIIATGKTCIFDADLSGFATGIASLTVTGEFEADVSGTLYLKCKGAIGGVGSFKAGTVGTPLTNTFIIDLAGNGYFNLTSGLLVELYCTEPLYGHALLSADEASGQTVLSVDRDITTSGWNAGDPLGIANVNKGLDVQDKMVNPRTFVSATATEITISAGGLDSANYTGAAVVLLTRNIEIRTSLLSNGSIRGYAAGIDCVFNCAMRNVAAFPAAYAFYAAGNAAADISFKGPISGYNVAFGSCYNIAVDGAVFCPTGLDDCHGFDIPALMCCTYAITNCSGCNFIGDIRGGIRGVHGSAGMWLGGKIIGPTEGVYSTAGVLVGEVDKCTDGIRYFAGEVRGAVLGPNNTYDILASEMIQPMRMLNTELKSATQVSGYLGGGSQQQMAGLILSVDPAVAGVPQYGKLYGWTAGGKLAPNLSPPASPPWLITWSHQFTCEDGSYYVFVDFAVWVPANASLIIGLLSKQSSTGWAAAMQTLIYAAAACEHNDSPLASELTANVAVWQQTHLEYKPATAGLYIVRFRCKNGSGTVDFVPRIRVGGEVL